MEWKDTISYYLRKDVQEAILSCAKNREVGVMIGQGFGKRPDILEYPADVGRMARDGATSFHISEERWKDPLALRTGLVKKQLDELRSGWDLLIDIDTPHWDYAKLTAFLLIEALKFHNVKSISAKFSGNKGFHIGVPFEAFPDEVNGVKIKDLYPEGLRIIAGYLQDMIRGHLATKILEKETIADVARKSGKQMGDLVVNGNFDPFALVEIDTVLISSRHLFRAPYSLHEKSGLASLPIKPSEIMMFEKDRAKPENFKAEMRFLEREKAQGNEARELLIQAFDWHTKKSKKMVTKDDVRAMSGEAVASSSLGEIKLPEIPIDEALFPPCMKKVLAGKMEDGKKRALFTLIKFLHHVGWSWDMIEERIRKWNATHPEPLRETFFMGQFSYAKKLAAQPLPPNCANANYYKDIRLCDPEPLCHKIRNPVNFARIRAKSLDERKAGRENFSKKGGKKDEKMVENEIVKPDKEKKADENKAAAL